MTVDGWTCKRCGSNRWVAASLAGPVAYGGKAIRQCVPCGYYSGDAVPTRHRTARLDWGCGPLTAAHEGWTTSDESYYVQSLHGRPPDHLGPIQDGLPWPDGHFDYVVSHHALMGLPEVDLVPALVELRRVTKPGGWLRVSVPDITEAIRAIWHHDRAWFPVEAEDLDEAFCRYVTQGGATRSIFTERRLALLLAKAGWASVTEVEFGYSPHGPAGITELDSRPNESIFMEAVNGG